MSDAALRSRLIRLASEHPSGSAERKALLDVLKSAGVIRSEPDEGRRSENHLNGWDLRPRLI